VGVILTPEVITPEVNLARRVIEKYDLQLPVDIEALLSQYAELIIADIPFDGVDGVCLNLKVPDKTTRVLVNKNTPRIRQRFTMAHELGHILIPWHSGTIIDHTELTSPNSASNYWTVEAEANKFAAELLMPYQYISDLINRNSNLAEIHKQIAMACNTSAIAAAIQLSQYLPSSIVYAYEKYGVIEFSGKTKGTYANSLNWGDTFPDNVFDYCEEHFISTLNSGQTHWWKLPKEIHIDEIDSRAWREILDEIIHDVGVPSHMEIKTKSSINGVMANANSKCKRDGIHNVDDIVSVFIQRFKDRDGYSNFVKHPLFGTFLTKRAKEFANNNNN